MTSIVANVAQMRSSRREIARLEKELAGLRNSIPKRVSVPTNEEVDKYGFRPPEAIKSPGDTYLSPEIRRPRMNPEGDAVRAPSRQERQSSSWVLAAVVVVVLFVVAALANPTSVWSLLRTSITSWIGLTILFFLTIALNIYAVRKYRDRQVVTLSAELSTLLRAANE